jgi:hypothetical protein
MEQVRDLSGEAGWNCAIPAASVGLAARASKRDEALRLIKMTNELWC